MADLYPADPLQALYCDEVLEALEDISHYIVQTFGLEGDALKQARETLLNGRLTIFIKGLAELLQRGGGDYFADRRLTIADLKMYTQLKQLGSGNVDHIPANFIYDLAPAFTEYQARVAQSPQVAAYYASIKSPS